MSTAHLTAIYLVAFYLVVRLTISAAATYAGCSRRYVERLLKTDFAKELKRQPDGTIEAEMLKKLCRFLSSRRRPGRRFGTKFLFRLPPYRKSPADDWRLSRVLAHLGEIRSAEAVFTIMDTAFKKYNDLGGITPAGSPKT